MVITLKLSNAKVPNIGSFGVRLGEVFKLKVRGYREVRWSAENDEVLDIDDNGGPIARIKALSVGVSHLTLRTGNVTREIDITVFDQGAVTLGGSIGPETPDN